MKDRIRRAPNDAAPLMERADRLLREVFGFESWRPLQREIVESVLSGRDALAILPTGGGKSLCYQVPALVLDRSVLVVSPLIALMADQIAGLVEAGIGAVALNSALSAEEWRSAAARARSGEARLVYVAPEALGSPRLLELIDAIRPALLAVDEAHCISHWGHDFRPDYRRIAELRARLPDTPCLAVTATATPEVCADIVESLALSGCEPFVASFDRPNLRISVEPKRGAVSRLLEFVAARPLESGIVYCMSRAATEDVAAKLRAAGVAALPYHAGLDKETRKRNQEAFVRDDVRVVVATVAFGMGVDKPDVRFVVHMDLPKNLESYYQEIGRAGRDGLSADCLLFYSYGDVSKLRRLVSELDAERLAVAEAQLAEMARYAEGASCRRRFILKHFGETAAKDCGVCDVCRQAASGVGLVDLGTEALKFLSAVARTGGGRDASGGPGFGAGHAADVLRGERTEKVERYGHDALSVFGIGADLSKAAWMELARRLLGTGHLEALPPHGVLKLTERAYAFFKEKGPYPTRPLALAEARLVKKGRAKGGGARRDPEAAGRERAAVLAGADGDESSAELFLELRRKRKELADSIGVPPYVVFSDRTLGELARRKPRNLEAMADIFGVGERKLARYGEDFLAVIRAWRSARGDD